MHCSSVRDFFMFSHNLFSDKFLQVHKELQDTMAQLEAIRHEIRSISFMNPGPLTTRLVDNIASQPPVTNGNHLITAFLHCVQLDSSSSYLTLLLYYSGKGNF